MHRCIGANIFFVPIESCTQISKSGGNVCHNSGGNLAGMRVNAPYLSEEQTRQRNRELVPNAMVNVVSNDDGLRVAARVPEAQKLKGVGEGGDTRKTLGLVT